MKKGYLSMDKTYDTWIEYASRDLASARHLLTLYPIPLEIICYHCQQSAEKFLKAYLIFQRIAPKRTHDLEELFKECIKFDESFLSIEEECSNLTDFAVNTRYPYELELTLEDTKNAIKDAEKIKEYILSKIS